MSSRIRGKKLGVVGEYGPRYEGSKMATFCVKNVIENGLWVKLNTMSISCGMGLSLVFRSDSE